MSHITPVRVLPWSRLSDRYEVASMDRRVVIDSNCLRNDSLRDYLAESRKNYAIVTDHLWMEAYQGENIERFCQHMEILTEFPRQLIALKGTQTVCGLRGRSAGQQRRLIDRRYTQEFPAFCQNIRAARNGDRRFDDALLQHGHEATSHLQSILEGASGLRETVARISANYTPNELTIIRTRDVFTSAMTHKFIKDVLWLAAFLFEAHPRVNKMPSSSELPYTFIFRTALCTCVRAIMWISVGGAHGKPEKIKNDIVDLNFAAYGTFFDGLLTSDQKLIECYNVSARLLDTMFLRELRR